MAEVELYPLRFKPVYKDYLWGGTKIVAKYQRAVPPGIYAESWEVSDRLDGMSVVTNGPLAGKPLRELAQRFGPQFMGASVRTKFFPLLIKLIDASDRLSVQVHPDDGTARRFGGEAKTEMWYVLDAKPDAHVYAGLKPGVNQAKFEEAIRTKRLEEVLNCIPVSVGDAIFVPGGRVHAIDRGCLMFEVQQNSNTTYRVYDWGRVGLDGKARPLHIHEALRVINWNDTAPPKVPQAKVAAFGQTEVWHILSSPFFRVERVQLADACNCAGAGATFNIFFVITGALRLAWNDTSETLAAGNTCLVPAQMPECRMEPVDGPAAVLRVMVP